MTSNVVKALPGLVVAAIGALVAFLFYAVHPATALLLIIPLAIGGWALMDARRLTRTDPLRALGRYSLAQLLPYSIAAAVSAVLIGLAVWLAPPKKPEPPEGTTPPPPTTFELYFPETLKALSGAMSAFLTAAFVKPTDDEDSWVAGQVKSAFQKEFEPRLNGKPEIHAVRSPRYLDKGWDGDGRRLRAQAIATALNLPPSTSP